MKGAQGALSRADHGAGGIGARKDRPHCAHPCHQMRKTKRVVMPFGQGTRKQKALRLRADPGS